MRTWIVGVGGVGAIVAGRLAGTLPDLLLIDEWADHVSAIETRGLTVDYPDSTVDTGPLRAIPPEAIAAELERPDVVLLCLKSYDTERASQLLLPLLKPSSVVVSLQNGMNVPAIVRHVGAERTVGASVLFDGELTTPGRARQARVKPLILGEATGAARPRTQVLAELLRPVAPVEVTSAIRDVLWTKLVNNTCNGLAAVTGLGLGRILEQPSYMEIWVGLAAEAIRVAQTAGIGLIPEQTYGGPPDAYLASPTSATGKALRAGLAREFAPYPELKSTMLQDLEKGLRTEIDHLSGYVANQGERMSIDTPLNRRMVELVHRAEAGWRLGKQDDLDDILRRGDG